MLERCLISLRTLGSLSEYLDLLAGTRQAGHTLTYIIYFYRHGCYICIMGIYTYILICTYIFKGMHVYICPYIYGCIYMGIYTYTFLWVYICIYTHKNINKLFSRLLGSYLSLFICIFIDFSLQIYILLLTQIMF